MTLKLGFGLIVALAIAGLASPVLSLAQSPVGNSYQAPRHPEMQPARSCPDDGLYRQGIYPFRFGPFPDGRNLINYATVVGKGQVVYVIFAGAPEDMPNRGLLRVWQIANDPCASQVAGSTSSTIQDWTTANGPLTIIRIDADTVTFSGGAGAVGRFDFVNGRFLR